MVEDGESQWRNLEKGWFRKIREDGVTSFAIRMVQGIFVGHHDRTGAVCALPRMEVCEEKAGQDRR